MKFVDNLLQKKISRTARSRLKPKEFFIADAGVPVLFFEGFPVSLTELMTNLQVHVSGLKEFKKIISDFQNRIRGKVNGYCWFCEESWHITLLPLVVDS